MLGVRYVWNLVTGYSAMRLFACWLLLIFMTSAAHAERVRFGLREAAPMVYTTAGGQLTGLEYDLLMAVMAAAGMQMEPFVGSNARLVVAATGEAVDGFAPVVGKPPPEITLTDPFIVYQNVALSLVSRKIVVNRADDLRHWRLLAFQRANLVLGAEFAAAVAAAPDYREEPKQALQANALLLGRYDLVVAETRILHHHIAQVLDATGARQRPLPVTEHRIFPPTHYSAGFRDPALAARFNDALQRIRRDGTYAAILARYDLT